MNKRNRALLSNSVFSVSCTQSDLKGTSTVIPRRLDLKSSAHSQPIPAPHRRQFAVRALRLRVRCYGIRFMTQFTMSRASLTNIFTSTTETFVYDRVWKAIIITSA